MERLVCSAVKNNAAKESKTLPNASPTPSAKHATTLSGQWPKGGS
jgi:hypothetical protein